MNDDCARRDLVSDPAAGPLLWLLPIAVIVVTGYFAGGGWIVTAGWTVSLLVMGSACLVNARACGRMHCYFTGPFFLIMAAVSLTYGLHLLPLGAHGWSYIGAVLLVGGVVLCLVPERFLGRYRSSEAGAKNTQPRKTVAPR
jgi:hypothetical protein